MSRLIKPAPGECADRQTILELRIKAGGGKPEDVQEEVDDRGEQTDKVVYETNRWILKDPSPVNIQPFLDESEMIQTYLENTWFPGVPPDKGIEYDKLYEELAEINTQLWKLEDEARTLRDAPDRMRGLALQRAAECLFAINDANDKRAGLVSKINSLFGVSVVEKIYA